ncbi:uncharacterized protein LOC105225804 isoform X2 [Bactrocera dorsalis]|uniref:Uncharacterized protein LOC105225804 isoform X2 n=1 Tax=Bactrocera dorsalis TaxID=27457 RepID=A0ABM3JDS0_BACDO|nr:uncharacterized protein LOC105225804 isoform X2 [Bactrocera dorsalis]
MEQSSQQTDRNPLANYQFSADEIRVLRECNSESFFQRSLPLGTALGVGAYLAVKNGFLQVNWVGMYETDNIDNEIAWFYNKLEEGITLYVPVHKNYVSNYPNWFSFELINRIKLKNAAHSQYKNSNNQRDYARFSMLRRDCKTLSTECYRKYVDKIENMVQSDTSAFWKFIKDKKYNRVNIPSEMSWLDQSATTGESISNLQNNIH